MKRVKYIEIGVKGDPSDELAASDKVGFLIEFGRQGGDTMAFVQDIPSGRVLSTYPEYVQFLNTPMDGLLDRILAEVLPKVAMSRRAEVEKTIVELFTRYAW